MTNKISKLQGLVYEQSFTLLYLQIITIKTFESSTKQCVMGYV